MLAKRTGEPLLMSYAPAWVSGAAVPAIRPPDAHRARSIGGLGVLYVSIAISLLSRPMSISAELLSIAVCAIGVAVLVQSRRTGSLLLLSGPALFVLWVMITISWSEYLESSAKSAAALVAVTVAGAVGGTLVDERDMARGIAWAGVLIALLSVAVAMAMPGIGRVTDEYQRNAIRGIYLHRNLLSFIMLVAAIAVVHTMAAARSKRARLGWGLGAVAVIGVLLGAASSTAIAVAVFTVAIMFAVLLLKRIPRGHRAAPGVLTLASLALGGVLVFSNMATAVALVGRDLTFTGRADIWAATLWLGRDRPWIGFGWCGVWDEWMRVGNGIRRIVGYNINHAHNGYLDIWIQVGLIGVILLLAVIVMAFVRIVRIYFARPSSATLWPFTFFVALLLYNLLESPFSQQPAVWFLIVATATVAARTAVVPNRTFS